MQPWERDSFPIEQCTPKQRVQRERMARERAVIQELGIVGFTVALDCAVRVVADPTATLSQIVDAIWWLDRDSSDVIRSYSKWADSLPVGRAPETRDEKFRRSQARIALETMTEPDSPKKILRERLYERLESLGYKNLDRTLEGIRPLREKLLADVVYAVAVSHHGEEAAKIMCGR